MTAEGWTILALTTLIPVAVWLGIQIGTLREGDRRRAQQQHTRHPSDTRHLLDWSNGKARSSTTIDEE